jgi:serine O-acetyltransferase
MFNFVKRFYTNMREDLEAAMERDPAARSKLEVSLVYPGVHAIWGYRVAHWLWEHHIRFLGRIVSQFLRWATGIEIHPGAKIGPGLFIDHGMGVVIGETAEIGRNVTLYHGVTLGGVSILKGKRHPTLGDNVVIGAGAKVLGAIWIGNGSRIGANAVVVKTVPPNSIVVGVPGQVIRRRQPAKETPDLNHGRLPDTINATLEDLQARMDELENMMRVVSLQPPATAGASQKHREETLVYEDISI